MALGGVLSSGLSEDAIRLQLLHLKFQIRKQTALNKAEDLMISKMELDQLKTPAAKLVSLQQKSQLD